MNYGQLASDVGPRTGATQEWVYQILCYGITSGELESGMQLKQDEISASLNVSHIPVREALRQLEVQGLVTIQPNRGATVTSLSRNEVLDMMEIRANLSLMKMRNSCPFLEEADFFELEKIIEAEKETEDLLKTEKLNHTFHTILLKHDENAMAGKLIDMVHDNIDRYVRKNFYERSERRERCIREHEEILEACWKREIEKACKLLYGHILNARDYIPIKF